MSETNRVIELNAENFTEHIQQGIVLIDFYAKWCGPCQSMSPIIDELAEEMSDKATICKCNIDDNQEIASKYAVASIPTFIILKNGEPFINKKNSAGEERSETQETPADPNSNNFLARFKAQFGTKLKSSPDQNSQVPEDDYKIIGATTKENLKAKIQAALDAD